jgi:LacI family asc operon transcriptional repressor
MTTMLEVARRAGVSKATVSRVLSGNVYTSQETRVRVCLVASYLATRLGR